MAELITQRVRRNAAELKLHGIAKDPDALSTAPRKHRLATASSSTPSSNRRSGCSTGAATTPA